MPFYEKGNVRIHYEEAGSGVPLLIIPGGGQNSTISWIAKNAPFNAIEEFGKEYRVITADLRNAPSGQSSGPLETDWWRLNAMAEMGSGPVRSTFSENADPTLLTNAKENTE